MRKFIDIVETGTPIVEANTAEQFKKNLAKKWKNYNRRVSRLSDDEEEDDEERARLEAEGELFDELEFDSNGKVLMYRKMIVDPAFITELLTGKIHHLGFHWATHKRAAIAYSFHGSRFGKIEVILCASVEFSELNWETCVDRVSVDESELLPFAESPLQLVALWSDNYPVKLPANLAHFVP